MPRVGRQASSSVQSHAPTHGFGLWRALPQRGYRGRRLIARRVALHIFESCTGVAGRQNCERIGRCISKKNHPFCRRCQGLLACPLVEEELAVLAIPVWVCATLTDLGVGD